MLRALRRQIRSDPMTLAAGVLAAVDPQALVSSLPPALLLQPNTLHVWAFTLEGTPAFVERCRNVLSTSECHRADRFVFARDRIHHTVAHGVLRHLLGRYCHMEPQSLEFGATSAGKPSLHRPTDAAAHEIRFNLTHSEDRAMLGVSIGRELGIDLERVRSNIEALAISGRYFFGSERQAIENAPSSMRDSTFFRYWVAKEAVLKAQGVGLGFPLDRFCVDFLPDGHTACIDTLDPEVLEREWIVRMLPCQSGWLGAVAARGNDWAVKIETVVTESPDL
jgi:4'-phosphopantetheinyl transferase